MDKFSISITTKARTKLCCYAIEQLHRKMRCSAKNIQWIVSCDSSTKQHCDSIKQTFKKLGIGNYRFVDSNISGCVANYNSGVKAALEYSEYCLAMEDDWILEKDLDIDFFIETMEKDPSVLKIRLGWISSGEKTIPYDSFYNEVVDDRFRFVTQVGLVSQKTHQILSWYENGETDLTKKAIALENDGIVVRCLIPKQFKLNALDDSSLYFTHAGKSEVGNGFIVPARYRYLNY